MPVKVADDRPCVHCGRWIYETTSRSRRPGSMWKHRRTNAEQCHAGNLIGVPVHLRTSAAPRARRVGFSGSQGTGASRC